jgi:hypothetical protein
MLTPRVAAVILFSAAALWAQIPEADAAGPSPASETATAFEPCLPEVDHIQSQELPQAKQFNLKPDWMRSSLAETRELKLAEFSNPFAANYPAASTSKAKTAALSNGYFTRRKIHRYASFATLPLLAAEAAVGQKLFDERDSESSSLRSVHSGLAAGMGVLFGVESVTGIWNMLEARKVAPVSKKRLFHGILMLAADAGFFATAATAPDEENRRDASAHKAIAYTSIGVAAFGYVYALIAK